MKKMMAMLLLAVMMISLAACGSAAPAQTQAPTEAETVPAVTEETTEAASESETVQEEIALPAVPELEDGVYTVNFDTDSGMFHVNESLDGKGTLVVQDGAMTVHVTLVSKSILNLYPGFADDAKQDEANWLQPTEDEVTYSDGYKETVYGFDVPVPTLNAEFPLALIGKKGTWYDHMVSVSNPVPVE